jgi:CheY-like chemotaxis protein
VTSQVHGFEEVVILLVEDDAGHARLIQKNLQRAGIHNEVLHLHGGQQALDFLFGTPGDGNSRPRVPMVMLLNLNMQGVSGYDVLERMKADAETHAIPVIVLTAPGDTMAVKRCYQLGCNALIDKPEDYAQFSESIRRLGLFLSLMRTPELEPRPD